MAVQRAGRYLLHDAIASGGMASVHLGRAIGSAGFSRTVAIKRLHPHLGRDPEFVTMFLDEARIASRVAHPNVVSTLDVVAHDGELLLVMEHVLGESWWAILREAREQGVSIPLDVVSAVASGMLNGLHAAHEARSEAGEPLEIVHRDVSPQNVLVGVDGVVRVVDFGIAKAISRVHSTRGGELKGKLAYMAPEQITRRPVDRRTDVYAAGVVIWESLTGARPYTADDGAGIIMAVLEGNAPPPSSLRSDVPRELDDLVLSAMALDPGLRPATAADFGAALEAIVPPAPPRVVGEFVLRVVARRLEERRRLIAEVEQTPSLAVLAEGTESPPSGPFLSPADRMALASADTAVTLGPAPAPIAPSKRASGTGVNVAAAIVLGLLAVAGAAGAYVVSSRRTAAAKPAMPVAESHAPPAVSAAPLVSPEEVSSAPLVPSSVSSGTPTTPKPTGHRTPSRRGVLSGSPPPRPVPTTGEKPGSQPPSNDCNPQYTLDDNGVKRFKPWCL